MPEQNPIRFNFWWATSETSSRVMGWVLAIFSVGLFVNGCNQERLIQRHWRGDIVLEILIGDVLIGVVCYYVLINIGRFAYYGINRTEAVQAMQEARSEKAELESLRRRKELKELRKELGEEPASKGTEPLIEAANEPRGDEASPMSETAFFLFM